MRGKVSVGPNNVKRVRITPAYAGKRCSFFLLLGFSWDHPRICGEKFNALPAELKAKGSPPHMRGKVGLKETQSSASRITPAYAGKSSPGSNTTHFCKDHPRICGEKVAWPAFRICCKGSPPHMRGKGGDGKRTVADNGITPAYAGKSGIIITSFL